MTARVIGTLAGRPAVIITFLEGMWLRRPTAAHCREVGKALAALHLAGAGLSDDASERACHRRLAQAVGRARARADEVEPGLAAEVDADFADFERELAEGPAGRHHPCRSFPGQCLLPRRKAVRA